MKNKKLELISAICIAIFILITVVVAVSMQKITQTTNQNLTPEQLRSQSYATLEEGNAYADDEKHVKFAAFFTEDNNYDGYAEMILGSCKEIGAQNTMFINVGVEEGGTLRNGVITINGDNFTYQMRMVKDSILKNNYVSNNVKSIELNNIQSGTQKIMMGDILAKITSPSSYSSDRNAITLTGTWVSEDGTQTQNIEKTIYLIEAKRLGHRGKIESMRTDFDRMKKKWKNINIDEDVKTYSKYAIIIADIWIPHNDERKRKTKERLLSEFTNTFKKSVQYEVTKNNGPLTENERYFILGYVEKIVD